MATPTIAQVWEYYNGTYKGNLTEDEFNKLAVRVEPRLTELINGKTVPLKMEKRYKLAFCELVDYTDKINETTNITGIEQETIDGYSVKYALSSEINRLLDEKRIAGKYLTYPVNLMYCGVEYTCLQTET